MVTNAVHFILYVSDQDRSAKFYESVLVRAPRLHVPGMTEFELSPNVVLGLMPEAGIKRLLGDAIQDPSNAHGIARSEVYLLVEAPQEFHARALELGAKELSPLEKRSWGHKASYCADPDGHVIAFACP